MRKMVSNQLSLPRRSEERILFTVNLYTIPTDSPHYKNNGMSQT